MATSLSELLDLAADAVVDAPAAYEAPHAVAWPAWRTPRLPSLRPLPAPGRLAIGGAVMLYLGLVLLLPLAALALRGAQAGLSAVIAALSTPEAAGALGRSALLVAGAVLVNGAFGVAAAVVLVRHRFAGRRVLDAVVDIPLGVSPVMTGLALLLLCGRGGPLQPALDALGVRVAFAMPGMFLATLFVTLPLTLREVGHVLAEAGTAEEEVAVTLGATPWQTFRLVTLPIVRNGLVYGLTLTAARALGEFGAVMVVGGAISARTQTATTFIYAAAEERGDAAAYGMALLLAAASMAFLIILQRAKRGSAES